MHIGKLAIFCGSKFGSNALYAQHAKELGKLLAEHDIEMVYGGGKNGLMGVAADSIIQNNSVIRGVIPELLLQWESHHQNISELLIVEDMHQRKRKIYEMCDAAIVLPGGFGTLDELFEILTWNQLSIHDKEIFILNSGGFYNHLIKHMQQMAHEGFLYGDLSDQFIVLNQPKELLKFLKKTN